MLVVSLLLLVVSANTSADASWCDPPFEVELNPEESVVVAQQCYSTYGFHQTDCIIGPWANTTGLDVSPLFAICVHQQSQPGAESVEICAHILPWEGLPLGGICQDDGQARQVLRQSGPWIEELEELVDDFSVGPCSEPGHEVCYQLPLGLSPTTNQVCYGLGNSSGGRGYLFVCLTERENNFSDQGSYYSYTQEESSTCVGLLVLQNPGDPSDVVDLFCLQSSHYDSSYNDPWGDDYADELHRDCAGFVPALYACIESYQGYREGLESREEWQGTCLTAGMVAACQYDTFHSQWGNEESTGCTQVSADSLTLYRGCFIHSDHQQDYCISSLDMDIICMPDPLPGEGGGGGGNPGPCVTLGPHGGTCRTG